MSEPKDIPTPSSATAKRGAAAAWMALSVAAAVTCVAVRCSAWLGILVVITAIVFLNEIWDVTSAAFNAHRTVILWWRFKTGYLCLKVGYFFKVGVCEICYFRRMARLRIRAIIYYILLQPYVLSEKLDITFARIEMLRLDRRYKRLYLAKFGCNSPVFNAVDKAGGEIVKVFPTR